MQTGERKQIPLTAEEIAAGLARKAEEDVELAALVAVMQRRAIRQAKLDAFLDKIEADPTILDRIR